MTIMSKVDHLELVTEFPSIHSISIYIVDDTGIEPVDMFDLHIDIVEIPT